MPNHDSTKPELSMVQDCDTKAAREARIKEVLEMGGGKLTRADAELMDDEAKTLVFAVMEPFLAGIKEFVDKKPPLGLAYGAVAITNLHANVSHLLECYYQRMLQETFREEGIVMVDNPEDLDRLLRGLFGE